MDIEQRFKKYQIQLDLCSSMEQYDQIMRIVESQRGALGVERYAELVDQAEEVKRRIEDEIRSGL